MQRAAAAPVAGPVHSVDQQDVLPSVVIVVEKGAPGAERLGQVLFAERAAIVPKVDAGGSGRVDQPELRRGPAGQHRAAAEQEVPAGHSRVTPPLRMAYTTTPAVRGIFSASPRIAPWPH